MRHEDRDAARRRSRRATPAAKRSNNECSVSASSAAVGSSSTHSSGPSRMKPRASASFCHCPIDSSTPSRHVGPSWVASPLGMRSITSMAPARPTAASTAGSSSDAVEIADADRTASRRTRTGRSPGTRPMRRSRHSSAGSRCEVDAVDGDATVGRVVEAAQQLHERGLARAVLADERDHRTRAQLEVHVAQHPRVGARVLERHVLEADRAGRAARAPASARRSRGGATA